jgi:hypothetical protein
MTSSQVPSTDLALDAQTTGSKELRRLAKLLPDQESPGPTETERRKRHKLRVRSSIAVLLVVLYGILTAYILVALVNGWAKWDDIKEFVVLFYGSLTGLVATAIALVGRKGG